MPAAPDSLSRRIVMMGRNSGSGQLPRRPKCSRLQVVYEPHECGQLARRGAEGGTKRASRGEAVAGVGLFGDQVMLRC
ncbi:hypothetical protein E2C01_095487 [Portunus trituberculatus]|uniref:Uncharacterized protein n=1 Tax=Portunus trituberculatus TaxID=210409 RepID=A0A5B7K4C5_PORTR|nr:hypothetical protein [Portunus trituberculatus]